LRDIKEKSVYRIIDANTNRLKEGLRVCEEIARFILKSRSLTESLKAIRHKLDKLKPDSVTLCCARDSLKDVGFSILARKELTRYGLADIFFANIQRAKESLRVLEEFTKLKDKKVSYAYKKIRYEVYAVEKKIAPRISALCNHR
jgi:thiamine-phosphate pyrophosphorylase